MSSYKRRRHGQGRNGPTTSLCGLKDYLQRPRHSHATEHAIGSWSSGKLSSDPTTFAHETDDDDYPSSTINTMHNDGRHTILSRFVSST